MIELVFPVTLGEWLAWLVAFSTMLVGLIVMMFPKIFMQFIGLGAAREDKGGISEIRGPLGGAFFGMGLAAILLAQPLIYAALGIAFAGMVLGRLLSFVINRAVTAKTLLATALEILGAFFPLAYTFGLIG